MTVSYYDVVIAGGGLSGTTLALALKNLSLKVALIETQDLINNISTNNPNAAIHDTRALGLAYISKQIFSGLGIWNKLTAQATPIKQIHISNQGHFGISRMLSQEAGVEALGYVVRFALLQKILTEKVLELSCVDIISPATIIAIEQRNDNVNLQLKKADTIQTISAKLLIAADGSRSKVCSLLNIDYYSYDYQQTALVTTVLLKKPHQHIAYERFTALGPLAFLPLTNNQYSVIWSMPHAEAERKMHLSEAAFLRELQNYFGYRLGKFLAVQQREQFPLELRLAKQQMQKNTIVIGNACHTLHPVAAQGFNLGLRDIAMLAQTLSTLKNKSATFSNKNFLNDYQKLRKLDHRKTILFTDTLVKIFSSPIPPIIYLRNCGLLGMDLFPLAKQFIAKHGMGFVHPMGDLMLGLEDDF